MFLYPNGLRGFEPERAPSDSEDERPWMGAEASGGGRKERARCARRETKSSQLEVFENDPASLALIAGFFDTVPMENITPLPELAGAVFRFARGPEDGAALAAIHDARLGIDGVDPSDSYEMVGAASEFEEALSEQLKTTPSASDPSSKWAERSSPTEKFNNGRKAMEPTSIC